MLTQLSTIKSRLAIPQFDVQHEAFLTAAIAAASARFDKETNRTLARTENATHEFPADDTEILPPCYPIETVTKFELKSTETEGWVEQPAPDFLIRSACVISLSAPLSTLPSALARITYTAGYVLPGDTPSPPAPLAAPLPPDLEHAATEQVAFWFHNRDNLGIKTIWAYHGTYQQFATLDLLPSAQAVLKRYERHTL